ncbi:MAG: hypothetical protein EOM63_06300 [Clostridia bacterium]|nr:hypothetical protein [Clostridia bacterium]
MSAVEILGIILGSSVLVAIINQIGNYIFQRRKRKDDVADREESAKEQMEELRAETSEQFVQVDKRFDAIETQVNIISDNTTKNTALSKAQAYDRVRRLGMEYIKAGQITAEELHGLMELHEAYKMLGGNGFLDKLMEEVNNLRIKVD